MKQGDYRGKSHKKRPEEYRAFWRVVMVFGESLMKENKPNLSNNSQIL